MSDEVLQPPMEPPASKLTPEQAEAIYWLKARNKRQRKPGSGRPRGSKTKFNHGSHRTDGIPSLPGLLRSMRSIFCGELRRLSRKVPHKVSDTTAVGLTDSERVWIYRTFTSTYKLWLALEDVRKRGNVKIPIAIKEDVPELSADELARLGKLNGSPGNGTSQ